jgi:hypothetical protein
MPNRNRFHVISLTLLMAAASIPLFFHAYLGWYSRFIADDFCTAWMADRLGVLRATWYWYLTWTGRYSATLLDSAAGVLGAHFLPFVTPAILILWLAALTWAIFSLLPAAGPRLLQAAALGTALLATTLLLAPSVPQSLYWGQGMRSVIPPLVLSACYLALFRRHQSREWTGAQQAAWLVCGVGATYFSGGFSETFTATQLLVLGAAALAVLLDRNTGRRQRMLVFAGLLGAVLAFVTVVVAPGNAVRQATFPPSPGVFEILRISAMGYAIFWAALLGSATHLAGLAGLIGMGLFVGLALGPTTRKGRVLLFILAAGLLLSFAAFPPAAYGTSDYPPERTQILPVYFVVVSFAFLAVLSGRMLATRFSGGRATQFLALATLALMLFSSVTAAGQLYALRDQYVDFVAHWDQVDVMIREARLRGDQKIVVPSYENWAHLPILGDTQKLFVNKCYSGYYGIEVSGRTP